MNVATVSAVLRNLHTAFQKICDDKLKYDHSLQFLTYLLPSTGVLFSHLTYLVQLLYSGKLLRPKYQ